MTNERVCANTPALSRRTLLAALPASILVPVSAASLPGTASVEDDTPILRVFREWRAYFEWAEGPATDGIDDDAFNEVCAKRREIEERMFALPCQNPIDVLAKLMAFTFNGADFADDDGSWSAGILAEAKSAVDGVLA